ncbi:hypothetical protein C8R45DRAFT_1083655 [Mycena sanguinolenta]|nr:hypothetical protein C8R45DRAFT_1083655 [Mycena sanguinolenta]
MTLTPASVRAAVLYQTERTRDCSKAEIERFIEQSELEIRSLESQISALELRDSQPLESQVKALIESRDSKRAQVLALRHLVSSIRTLPVELLAEIFEHAIQDETHVEDAHRVSQVCSDWRHVAHSTPRLWTRRLRVALCKEGDAADGLRAWLARSAPLSLQIHLIPAYTNNPRIMKEVLEVAPRLRSFHMPNEDNNALPLRFLRQLSGCKLDALEELHLGFVEGDTIDNTPTSFTVVPRLRKLSIINEDVLEIVAPWAQLTDLTFECDSPDVTAEVLSQCANLTSASLNVLEWRLRSLDLRLKADFTSSFFDYLSTPVLQELKLEWEGRGSIDSHLMQAPNITSLELVKAVWFTSENLVAAIRHASSLTHLKISGCEKSFTDVFIRALYNDGVAPLAPCLHNLVVRNRFFLLTEEVLAGMIASRWWPDTELATHAAPAVARWTYVELQFGWGDRRHCFGPLFTDIVKDVPAHILVHANFTNTVLNFKWPYKPKPAHAYLSAETMELQALVDFAAGGEDSYR